MKLSEVVAAFIELRDKKSKLKAEYDAAKVGLEDKMAKIEGKLLEAFEATGLESIKTEAGTAYKTTRTSASVADKDIFMQFVKANEEWSLIETRCSKEAVSQYKAGTGEFPPGINWSETAVVNIRRSS